jgi:hypothetical protein
LCVNVRSDMERFSLFFPRQQLFSQDSIGSGFG